MLHDPLERYLPAFRNGRVAVAPPKDAAPGVKFVTEKVRRPIQIRDLLTHTAGFSYDIWDPDTTRCVKAVAMPPRSTGKVATIRQLGRLHRRGAQRTIPRCLLPRQDLPSVTFGPAAG